MKQVIIIRKDLKMRRGKEIAQGAHAAMMTFINPLYWSGVRGLSDKQKDWIKSGMKKIVVVCNSVEELSELNNKALFAGIETNIITDSGITEFAGRPTNTCCAIGPDDDDKIDAITGHLTLY